MLEDNVQVYDPLFALMDKSDDDDDDKVTLMDIKENLKNYSLKELKFLATILKDTFNNLIKDKECLKKDI